jgi:peptidoglycan/LPS O-acetylase OafA/YrhL
MATAQVEQRLRGLPAIVAIFRHLMPSSGAMREIAALDGLRALAILLVLEIHLYLLGSAHGLNVGPPIVAYFADMGFSGVYLFFVLSGFLLFLPYARSLLTNQPWPSARLFYLRRALRILPAYYAVLATLLMLPARPLLRPQYLVPLSLAALLFHDLNVNAFNITFQLDSPFWTLAIEWQFYLLLPWIALALAKLAGARAERWFFPRLALGVIMLIVAGLLIRSLAAIAHYV